MCGLSVTRRRARSTRIAISVCSTPTTASAATTANVDRENCSVPPWTPSATSSVPTSSSTTSTEVTRRAGSAHTAHRVVRDELCGDSGTPPYLFDRPAVHPRIDSWLSGW